MGEQKIVRYSKPTRRTTVQALEALLVEEEGPLEGRSRGSPGTDLAERLGPTVAQAEENLGFLRAPRTLEAYKKEWKKFVAWRTENGLPSVLPTPPEFLVLYVAHLGTRRKPKGIGVAVAAIAWYHRVANETCANRHPLVKNQLESLRRRYGTRPNKKKPLTIELLFKVLAEIPDDLTGARDSALLMLCYAAGGLRRSEVVALDVENVQFVDKGALVLIEKSKTDQEGKGVIKAVPFAKKGGVCPVRALRHWLYASGIKSGAIFRSLDDARVSRRNKRPDDRLSDHAVAEIVKDRLAAAGLEDIDIENFSGHSIRRGFATSAADAGQDALSLAKTVGWADTKMAFEYVDQANLFEKHAGKDLF